MRTVIYTAAVLAILAVAVGAAVTPPTFPTAYSAKLSVVAYNGQSATMNAYWQRSLSFNGTAYIGNSGTTVWDFGNGNNGNVYSILADRCQCYCPIQGTLQCNLQDSLCTYDYKHSAKFVGSGSIGGVAVNRFYWMEGLGPIPMNTVTLSVNQQSNAPVFQVRVIEPFGKYQGTENTTWTSFSVGTPPASVWNVPDKEYCQQCGNCNDASFAETFIGAQSFIPRQ